MQSKLIPQLTHEDGQRIWKSLQKDLGQEGLFNASALETSLRFLFLLIILAFGFWLAWDPEGSALKVVLGNIILALVLAQFAFLGHDSAHGALTGKKTVSTVIGEFCMTVVNGLCFLEWRSRHVEHHLLCQHEATDPDMQVSFVASLTKDAALKKKGLALFFTRIQAYTLWPLSFGFGHSQRFLGQAGAFMKPKKFFWDLIALIFHYGLWIAFPLLVLELSWSQVLLVYLIPLTLLGPYLAAIFWVNHLGMPLVEDTSKFSFFEHQVRTTRNVLPLPGTAWLYGGLCYQIEHHLFPTIPSYRLGKAKVLTQKRVEEAGMSYHECGWGSAIAAVARHFKEVSRI